MVDFSSHSARRYPGPERLLAALAGGLVFFAAGAAGAQTTVYTDQYGNPTVEVDLSVLDKLGPPRSLPDIYRQTAPTPSRPTMATRPPSRGLLAPPPRSMPKSRLTLPKEGLELKAPGAAPPPPAPRDREVARTKPVEVPAPARLTPPKSVEAPKPAAAPDRTPAPAPPKVATAPKVAPPATKPPEAKPPRVKVPAPPEAATSPPVKAPGAVSPPAPPPVKAPAETASSSAPPAPAPPPVKAPSADAPAPAQKTAALSQPKSAPAGSISISPDGSRYQIPFAAEATDLPDNAGPALDNLAERMNKNEDLRLQLMGYAGPDAGSASQARRSSLFRALAVRTYLMKQGVRSTRMDVRALGQGSEEGPPDRVDIVVVQ